MPQRIRRFSPAMVVRAGSSAVGDDSRRLFDGSALLIRSSGGAGIPIVIAKNSAEIRVFQHSRKGGAVVAVSRADSNGRAMRAPVADSGPIR
jgi:hypothetical protein